MKRCFILWESLERKCYVSPPQHPPHTHTHTLYCLYPRFLLSPKWNNLKMFHCRVPLAMAQDPCHVSCIYCGSSRNTIRGPVFRPDIWGGGGMGVALGLPSLTHSTHISTSQAVTLHFLWALYLIHTPGASLV